jgi:rhodanese-related sulfurtransferase
MGFVVLWIFVLFRIASSFLRERRTASVVFVLLAVTLSLSSYQHLISRKGFLNNQDAIQNVIGSNLNLFLPRIGYHDLRERVFNDGALIVDARNLKQHALGAIPGSVCVSPASSDKELASLLRRIALDKTVIVYCNNRRCGSDLALATRLSRLGFVDLQIYDGGYEDWMLHSKESAATVAPIKRAVQ